MVSATVGYMNQSMPFQIANVDSDSGRDYIGGRLMCAFRYNFNFWARLIRFAVTRGNWREVLVGAQGVLLPVRLDGRPDRTRYRLSMVSRRFVL